MERTVTTPADQTVVVLCADLFFTSQIEATARAAGIPLHLVESATAAVDQATASAASRLLVDLSTPGLDPHALMKLLRAGAAAAGPGTCPQVIGFGPHVQKDLLDAARQAGFDQVMPRSRFSAELSSILGGAV